GTRAGEEEAARCRGGLARRTVGRAADGLCYLRACRHWKDIPDHVLCGRGRHSRRYAEEFPKHVARRYGGESRARADVVKGDESNCRGGRRSGCATWR